MKFLKRAFLALAFIGVAFASGPVIERALAQGLQLITTLNGTEQIVLNYPCTVSCGVTTATLKNYVNANSGGVNAQTGTSYTFQGSDLGKLVTFNNASSIAATLPQATAATFASGTTFTVANLGAGVLTITPTTSTINGASTFVVNQNRSLTIFSDGTNYQIDTGSSSLQVTPAAIAEGGTGSATAATARTALAVPGLATANTFTAGLQQLGSASGVPVHASTAQTTAPALTSCGTGSPAITGTDTAGIVTLGTSATGCVITFNVAYTGTPYCVVTWIATPLASQSYVTAAATITLTQTSASGNKVQYICVGTAGG